MNTTDIDLAQFQIIHARVPQRPYFDPDPLRALLQMLESQPLDPRCDMRDLSEWGSGEEQMPFRGACWGHCKYVPIEGIHHQRRLVATKPIHPDHPEAVRFWGNFFEYSFSFELDTDDKALIAFLDARIAENMATPAYQAAKDKIAQRLKRCH
ncbi:hypothetical protein RQP54_17695 [Curvibacter sp. APW13]|uniref:hypothetical protein n=1 Tax=Curvibacter sp. APW13 TaxID=3077236 RepID=UPI0028E09C10|nr:hypothetical protein [Curvibacter sp. APW13]MDT8992710.1 hypothetical protein [Curvibacter sp. APW13]